MSALFCTTSHLAPDKAERPDGNDVDDGRERDTDDDEDEVGGGEADDKNVGRVAHVLVSRDDDNHRQVTDESERSDETEYDWNDDADQVLEGNVGAGDDLFGRAVGRRRVVDTGSGC